MALPQRDNTIACLAVARRRRREAIKRTDALLEYAVEHGMLEEAERLRETCRPQPWRRMKLIRMTEKV